MAYTKRQREMRRCVVIKSNGERCKGFAKIDGDRCSLHAYQHRRELPKTEAERTAAKIRRDKKRAGKQRRFVCTCPAFDYPHRLSSGGCRYPDDPLPPTNEDYVSPSYSMEYSPGFEQDKTLRAGSVSRRWNEVIDYDEQGEDTSAGRIEWSDEELNSEQVPTNRDEREAFNQERLRRLIEREKEKEAKDFTFHY